MTVFTASYRCTAGWKSINDIVGGERCVACGIIKKKLDVYMFIIDPNGIQGFTLWEKYSQKLY